VRTVGVRELKQHASEIVRRLREKQEEVAVTFRGEVVARLVPVARRRPRARASGALWTDLDRLAREIGARWPKTVGGAQAVSRDRRG